MALETRLFQKMTQQLVMTPQLRQAIKILQISRTELETLIDEQLTENPVLETSLIEPANGTPELTPETPAHDGVVADNTDPAAEKPKEENANDLGQIDWKDYFESYGSEYNGATTNETDSDDERRPAIENTLTRGVTLSDYLEEQVRLAELPDEEKEIAGILIGNIDRDGYLKTTIEEVANFAGVREEKVESVLRKLQEFDPPGVFASDLADCLLIQLRLRGDEDTLAARLIRDHLPFLENRRFDKVAKELGITIEEIVAAARSITTLEPKPGRNFGDGEARYVTPDVTVVKVGDEFVVTLNDDGMPRLRMSQTYLACSPGTAPRKRRAISRRKCGRRTGSSGAFISASERFISSPRVSSTFSENSSRRGFRGSSRWFSRMSPTTSECTNRRSVARPRASTSTRRRGRSNSSSSSRQACNLRAGVEMFRPSELGNVFAS